MIKTFEAFKQEDYYTQISDTEYWDLLGDDKSNMVDFNSDEIEEIKKHIKSITTDFDRIDTHTISGKKYLYLSSFKRNVVITICKIPDEWFLVALKADYKCDQMEGLLRFLTDKIK